MHPELTNILKKLTECLFEKVPRPNKATTHLISSGEIREEICDDEDDYDEYSSIPIELIEKTYPGITQAMRRGDIIEDVDESGYRSQGVFFFDGEKTVDQYFEIDDYGSPPKEFCLITEFPPGYWDSPLNINQDFCSGKSEFYWHDPCGAPSPLDLDKLPKVRERLSTRAHVIFNYSGKRYVVMDDVYSARDNLLFVTYSPGDLNTAREEFKDLTIDYALYAT